VSWAKFILVHVNPSIDDGADALKDHLVVHLGLNAHETYASVDIGVGQIA
jgi:hypothetical protein